MKIIMGIENIDPSYRGVVLTMGNFDGAHIGHQKVFRAVAEHAKAIKGTAAAITFDPHPMRVIAPERGLKTLTFFDEKARLMGIFGIDLVVCIRFDSEFAKMEADDFIRDVIAGRIGAREVIVGHDYAFGRGKKGTTALLRRRGRKYGFRLRVIRNTILCGDVVSSSRIRNLLGRGRVCEAARFLGRPYMIEGTVVKGAGRGRRLLDAPTANIIIKNELVPKEGVYAVKARLGKNILDGVANIGRNPTFGDNPLTCETHIFGFSENILNRHIKIYFIDRIRDEKTFPDIESLRNSIVRDIRTAKSIFKLKKPPKLI